MNVCLAVFCICLLINCLLYLLQSMPIPALCWFFPKHIKNSVMLTLILLLSGLVCFYLFYKSIDFFEKI
jgi:hypothetical protein